jgi:hypothetical protein
MRYAHLSQAYLSAEVGLLDAAPPTPPSAAPQRQEGKKRATGREARAAGGEGRRISEAKWLLGLDSNQQPSG